MSRLCDAWLASSFFTPFRSNQRFLSHRDRNRARLLLCMWWFRAEWCVLPAADVTAFGYRFYILEYRWHFIRAARRRMNGLSSPPPRIPALFLWILGGIVENVTVISIHKNTSIPHSPYTAAQPQLYTFSMNRPRWLRLVATVAMCNIVELHLSMLFKTWMTNLSRSTLKALRKASTPSPPTHPPWPSPGCFLITL